MDQDSFRRLLDSGGSSASKKPQKSQSRGSLLVPGGAKASTIRKTVDASEPAFKPRKVKKDANYRDRAAERRAGEGNDYAQVEAVLEDFEKRVEDKNVTDEQRKYLGGDSDHSILVRGLDMALLEQNKAKASLSTVDDDSLEQAYLNNGTTDNAAAGPAPKKRTREDMIRELKEKRGGAPPVPSVSSEGALEAAKKQGKFKPIGFKPIGAADEKPKKKKVKGEQAEERKKKKRKVETRSDADKASESASLMPPPPAPSEAAAEPTPSTSALVTPPPDDDMPDDDFDIFAGAAEYTGVDLGDEEEEEDTQYPEKPDASGPQEAAGMDVDAAPRKWFEDDEPDLVPSTSKLPLPTAVLEKQPPAPRTLEDGEEDEENPEQPTRLVPLSSSAMPSIKDFLAMDDTGGSSKKKKKGKRKKKSGKGGDDDDEDD